MNEQEVVSPPYPNRTAKRPRALPDVLERAGQDGAQVIGPRRQGFEAGPLRGKTAPRAGAWLAPWTRTLATVSSHWAGGGV